MKEKQYTLSESVVALDSILEKAALNRNRLGYFAAFVRKYSLALQSEPNQSEAFRLLSSSLVRAYVKHYKNYEVMNEPVKSWMTAFNESSSWWTTISQQFIMSMICYVRITCPKALLKTYDAHGEYAELKEAYDQCIHVLEKEWTDVLKRLSMYSSLMSKMLKNKQYSGIGLNDFDGIKADSVAFIERLLDATQGERQRKLNLLDYEVHAQVEKVSKPNDINKLRLKILRLSERKTVKDVIDLISKD